MSWGVRRAGRGARIPGRLGRRADDHHYYSCPGSSGLSSCGTLPRWPGFTFPPGLLGRVGRGGQLPAERELHVTGFLPQSAQEASRS